MSWITFDYRCNDCQVVETQMMKRSEVTEEIPCPDCDGIMSKLLVAQIARVSYPDGTTDRFSFAKQKRELDKMAKSAKRSGDLDSYARIKQENAEVRHASKSEKQAINICKVEEK